MKFVQWTEAYTANRIWIDMDEVVAVENLGATWLGRLRMKADCCRLSTKDGMTFTVMEDPYTVLESLGYDPEYERIGDKYKRDQSSSL